jgi:hypothetical protein
MIARLSPGQSATPYRVLLHVSLPDAGINKEGVVGANLGCVVCRWGGWLARAAVLARRTRRQRGVGRMTEVGHIIS